MSVTRPERGSFFKDQALPECPLKDFAEGLSTDFVTLKILLPRFVPEIIAALDDPRIGELGAATKKNIIQSRIYGADLEFIYQLVTNMEPRRKYKGRKEQREVSQWCSAIVGSLMFYFSNYDGKKDPSRIPSPISMRELVLGEKDGLEVYRRAFIRQD